MRHLVKFVIIPLLLSATAWAACSGSAPTWTCTPDYTSVNGCVNGASCRAGGVINGDTVLLSSGSVTWSNTLSITKGITLRVAPSATVTITDSAPSQTVFSIRGTGSNPVRVSGDNGASPDKCGGTGSDGTTCGLIINGTNDSTYDASTVWIQGPVTAFRIDHVFASRGDRFLCSNCSGSPTGPATGVIDHSRLTNYGRTYFAQDQRSTDGAGNGIPACHDGTYAGATAWSEFLGHEASYAGAQKEVYFEDDTITWTAAPYPMGQGALYGQYGGKAVIRHSILSNWSPFVVDESDNPACGSVFFEIYNNTISEACTLPGSNCQGMIMDLRSGQLLIHDNTITGTSIPFRVTVYPNGTETEAHKIHNSYFWNNTWGGTACKGDGNEGGAVCLDVASDSAENLGRNSNYWLRAPTQPTDVYFGYTPLTYPHPLQSGGGSAPNVPTGLMVVVQ